MEILEIVCEIVLCFVLMDDMVSLDLFFLWFNELMSLLI